MFLKQLHLRDYRNYKEQTFITDAGVNVIYGRNAQGKTNLLESIYLLGNYKSFRTQRNNELIGAQADQAIINARIKTGGVEHKISMSINRENKKVTVDEKKSASPEDVSGLLRPVLFSPDEVGIVSGSPADRRALIDRAIFHTNPAFLILARNLNRSLRQRNKLLRTGDQGGELPIWTEYLIEHGAAMRQQRRDYVARLAPRIEAIYKQIAGQTETDGEAVTVEMYGDTPGLDYKANLRLELERVSEREKIQKTTLAGPQRDDPLFKIDGRPLRQFGSQGQKKSFILAFKIAQIEDLQSRFGVPPILLLDDFGGELDSGRRQYLFEYLCRHRGQIFITTTDRDILNNSGLTDADFYRVDQGMLFRD